MPYVLLGIAALVSAFVVLMIVTAMCERQYLSGDVEPVGEPYPYAPSPYWQATREDALRLGMRHSGDFATRKATSVVKGLQSMWMTAGNGIVHEEFHSQDFTRKGGTLQMVQLWVNLRAKDKSAKPRYQTLLKAQIPTVELPQDAGMVRVIAGEYAGHKGPAKTFTPINLWDVSLRAGKTVELPLPAGHTTAFLVLSGEVTVNGEREGPSRTGAREGDLAIFARAGDSITVKAETDAKLLVMDGEPMAEPIVGQGPFVMNSRAEIQQAFEDYQLGRMGEIPV